MHFWIDKRSQTCSFSGRHRVPSSLSARGGGGRRWVGGVKPMVTPVHRFHQVECTSSQFPNAHQTRRPRQSTYPQYYNENGEGCSDMGHSRGHAEVDSSVYLEGSPSTPPPHLEALEPNRDGGKFRCGMGTPFALFILVASAKLYFNLQGTGVEVLFTCTVLVVILYLIAACTLSLRRSRTQRETSEGQTTTPVARLEVIEVSSPPPPPPTNLQEPPPPPYHIAITFPQRITPPPSYDKAVS